MCKISVLIVTYENGAYLRECLDSVLAQTCEAQLEIIVVDDGSTDSTEQIVKEYPQVKYIYQEHQGVSAARNRAMGEASGEYMAFLDADDWWHIDKLHIQMEYLKEHEDCHIIFTAYENFLEASVSVEEKWVQNCIAFALRDRTCLPTALFRRRLYELVGNFSVDLERGEDTEWTRRGILQGIKTAYIDQCLYFRRLHGHNLTQRSATAKQEELRNMWMNVVRKNVRTVASHRDFLQEGISVIIPVWNGASYIKDCIESVQKQKADLREIPLEIIVADDGSTDETVKIAEDCGVSVYQLEHRGAAAAKNAGMIKAQYSYVFFIDSDDRLVEGALAILYRAFLEEPMLKAVFSYARDFYTLKETGEDRVSERVYSGCLPGCALIRKSVFRKVGLFNENLKTGETVEWTARFRESGLANRLLQAVTLERRIHDRNTGRVMRNQEQQDYAQILREHLRRKKEREKKT